MTDAVCQDLLQRAGTLVDYECSVILDGDFFKASSLQQAYQWSQRRQALAAVIVCECPRAVALERLVTRSSGPGVHPPDAIRRYARQYRQQEPIPSQLPICHVDTTQSPPEMLQTVFRFLGGLLWPNWDPS
jgi:predicted kinase